MFIKFYKEAEKRFLIMKKICYYIADIVNQITLIAEGT